MKKYFHITSFGSSVIVHVEEENVRETVRELDQDGNEYGPFDTFTACKEDALQYHLTDKDSAQMAINNLKGIKKGDV